MIDLDLLHQEWEKDCEIDEFHLDQASLLLPKLHSKYLQLLNTAKNDLRDAELKHASIIKNRKKWYDGLLSKQEMDYLKWDYDPYDGKLVKTKTQKEEYLKTDEVLLQANHELEKAKNVIETIESMIDNIRWRGQVIKNAIDWKKFEAGF
jgi:hypothetical protein